MDKTQYMSEFKYKVGDKVRIKSLDWYYENKDADGFVHCGDRVFDNYMSVFCESIVTIGGVGLYGYDIREDLHCRTWTNEMIDCLVERNGKTYPYKIGDRVILKGNNRCATITDLKYNSFGNLSYYIKIDNDKDISTDCPTELLLPYDNMIEGLVEETKPEFNIGDKITDGKTHLTILNIISDKYIVEDNLGKCGTLYFNSQDYWKLVEEESIIDLTVKGEEVKERIEITIPEGYEYVIESGKIIFTKKKKEYPKTFEECVSVLMLKGGNRMPLELMNTFRKLIDARNAYWTIYGIENGLGKPWEPTTETVYCISRSDNVIKCSYRGGKSNILEFPTEEMRDAFYENFKEEIEMCKEFL